MAAQQLIEALKGAVPGSHKELEALKRMSNQFEEIAANKAKEKHMGSVACNTIQKKGAKDTYTRRTARAILYMCIPQKAVIVKRSDKFKILPTKDALFQTDQYDLWGPWL